MAGRVLIYVQHLLGIGHLVRCQRIAHALAADEFDVAIVSGGLPTPGLEIGTAALTQLLPVKSTPDFAGLVHADGRALTAADQESRRDQLLSAFDRIAPDILITEAFPFGRRQMRFELLPLLERAKSRLSPPLIAASIRDILQENRKPGRTEETAALIERYYDLVLVHGDARLCPLEATFRLADRFPEKIAYTGIVAPASSEADTHHHDVIVSAGGGAVGLALLEAAAEAKPFTGLAEARWLFVTGPNLGPAGEARLRECGGQNIDIVRFVPDLPRRLKSARLSISQAGYNTVADILVAGCRSVLVPYAAGGETEQPMRAKMLEERGLAIVLPELELSPGLLARAIDQALKLPPKIVDLSLDGAAGTAKILRKALLARSSL